MFYAGTSFEGDGELRATNKEGKVVIYAGAAGGAIGNVRRGDGFLMLFDNNGDTKQIIPAP